MNRAPCERHRVPQRHYERYLTCRYCMHDAIYNSNTHRLRTNPCACKLHVYKDATCTMCCTSAHIMPIQNTYGGFPQNGWLIS